MKKILRPLIILVVLLGFTGFYFAGGKEILSFENLKYQLSHIQALYQERPLFVISIFMSIYILMTSLSIPGTIVLTILAGAIFGVMFGTLLVSICTTIGASVAFLMARFLFREAVAERLRDRFQTINQKIQDEGQSYLFTLRLLPASPFVVINLVMGLTNMKLSTFGWITFVGMIPGSFIYVFAGRKFVELDSPGEILSWSIILALVALSVLPFIWKFSLRLIHRRRPAH